MVKKVKRQEVQVRQQDHIRGYPQSHIRQSRHPHIPPINFAPTENTETSTANASVAWATPLMQVSRVQYMSVSSVGKHTLFLIGSRPSARREAAVGEEDIRELREELDLALATPFHDMADEIGDIPGLGDAGQADVLHAEVVAHGLDLGLGRGDDQAADAVSDAHEGVAVDLLAVLVVAELPALVVGAAAGLLLGVAHGADVVVVGAAAGVVDVQGQVVRVAVVLEEVVAAGLDQGVQLIGLVGCSAAIAHGAVEGVAESCWYEKEKGRCLDK